MRSDSNACVSTWNDFYPSSKYPRSRRRKIIKLTRPEMYWKHRCICYGHTGRYGSLDSDPWSFRSVRMNDANITFEHHWCVPDMLQGISDFLGVRAVCGHGVSWYVCWSRYFRVWHSALDMCSHGCTQHGFRMCGSFLVFEAWCNSSMWRFWVFQSTKCYICPSMSALSKWFAKETCHSSWHIWSFLVMTLWHMQELAQLVEVYQRVVTGASWTDLLRHMTLIFTTTIGRSYWLMLRILLVEAFIIF